MNRTILLLTIGAMTLFANSKDVCSNVEILNGVITPKSSSILEKQVFEDGCKVIEIKKNYAVRCGCYKTKEEVTAKYNKLKIKYPYAKITKSYAYRFKEDIDTREKSIESIKKPLIVKKDKIVVQPKIKEIEKKDENTTKNLKIIEKVEDIEEVAGIEEVEVHFDKKEVQEDITEEKVELKEKEFEDTTSDEEHYKEVIHRSKYNILISTNIAYSLLDIDVDNSNNIVYDENIKLDLLALGFGIDYYLNSISIGLDYQYAQNSQMRYNNIFTTLAYHFKHIFASPQIGVIAGFSNMRWQDYPLKEIGATNSSWSMIGGFEFGGSIPITKKIEFYSQYRYLFMDFQTLTKEGTKITSINTKRSGSFIFGFSYKL